MNRSARQYILALVLIFGAFALAYLAIFVGNRLIAYPSGPMLVVGFYYALYTWTKFSKQRGFL